MRSPRSDESNEPTRHHSPESVAQPQSNRPLVYQPSTRSGVWEEEDAQDVCDLVRSDCSRTRDALRDTLDVFDLAKSSKAQASGHSGSPPAAIPPVLPAIAILRGLQPNSSVYHDIAPASNDTSLSKGLDAVAQSLVGAGFAFAEVPLNRPGALSAISELAAAAGRLQPKAAYRSGLASSEDADAPLSQWQEMAGLRRQSFTGSQIAGISSCNLQGTVSDSSSRN